MLTTPTQPPSAPHKTTETPTQPCCEDTSCHALTAQTIDDNTRALMQRRIRWIVGFTISYNIIEAIVALAAGSVASSTALIGFGLDSTIEVLSAAAVAWQFSRTDPQRWEKSTLRVIAIAFFALAAYVTVSSLLSLAGAAPAEHSTVGIVLTALSVIIMPVLSYLERTTARQIGSRSATADSQQTMMCTYLSAAVLIGLVANSLFGWWWADPVAGLVLAAVAAREGWQAWHGDTCCG